MSTCVDMDGTKAGCLRQLAPPGGPAKPAPRALLDRQFLSFFDPLLFKEPAP
jgi:hypothetical protein